MTETISEQDLLQKLEEAIVTCGSQGAFAREHGVNPAAVSMVRRGVRRMLPGVAAALGYQRVVTYRKMPRKRR